MSGIERPPPVHILLAYAADGWAAENGRFNPSGKPKPPDNQTWLPVARTLLREADGLIRLRDLTLAGMAAWAVDPTITACVAPAFATADFADRLGQHLAALDGPQAGPPPAPPPEPLRLHGSWPVGPSPAGYQPLSSKPRPRKP